MHRIIYDTYQRLDATVSTVVKKDDVDVGQRLFNQRTTRRSSCLAEPSLLIELRPRRGTGTGNIVKG